MQLRIDALDAHLAKTLAPLYVITSDEHLLALEAADKIRRAARAQGYDRARGAERGAQLQVGRAAGGQPVAVAVRRTKLIELRIPSGKPGKDGGAGLAGLCVKDLSPDNLTLITLPKLDWADAEGGLGGGAAAGRRLHRHPDGRAQRSCRTGSACAWPRSSRAPTAQGIDFIADRVEGNLLAAHQEIQKLALLHPAGQAQLRADPRCSAERGALRCVQAVSEAMLAGDAARLVRMLEGLKGEGEALPLVLWAVAEEIRTLLKLKAGLAQGQPLPALLKEYRIWGPRETLMEPALRRLPLATAASRRCRKRPGRPDGQGPAREGACRRRVGRAAAAGPDAGPGSRPHGCMTA